MNEFLAWGQNALAKQPFSTLLGAELHSLSNELTELRIPIKSELKQQHGFVHGGVLSYAADNTLTFAGGSALGPNVVTSEFTINYLRPAIGDCIIARATVIHAGRNQAVCRCEVYVTHEGGEKLCATAQGTIAKLGNSSQSSSGQSD